jgi:hypothetical protein
VDTSESDFYYFSLSDSTSIFNNIRHYPYPFSIKIYKNSYLFPITNIINFYNKDIIILSLLVNILVLAEITFIIFYLYINKICLYIY